MSKGIGSKLSLFRRLSLFTLIAVYFLIIVGGIVRSTGSGMGCPDWPKCFGKVVPPTNESELPDDYKTYYSNYRHQKNVKFAGLLANLGFSDIGEKILADETIREESDFNVYKTWTEYVNRLVGAFIGLFITATFIGSLFFIKSHYKLTVLGVILIITVGVQGWLGSVVVSTNLLPWLITSHMLLALLIVGLLIWIVFLTEKYNHKIKVKEVKQSYRSLIVLLIVMLLIQIAFGTRVREAVDVVAAQLGSGARDAWIAALGFWFYIHRSFSILIAVISGVLIYKLMRSQGTVNSYKKFVQALSFLVIAEIVLGVIMAYFGIPPFAQPLHLLLSSLLLGILVYQYLIVNWNLKNLSSR